MDALLLALLIVSVLGYFAVALTRVDPSCNDKEDDEGYHSGEFEIHKWRAQYIRGQRHFHLRQWIKDANSLVIVDDSPVWPRLGKKSNIVRYPVDNPDPNVFDLEKGGIELVLIGMLWLLGALCLLVFLFDLAINCQTGWAWRALDWLRDNGLIGASIITLGLNNKAAQFGSMQYQTWIRPESGMSERIEKASLVLWPWLTKDENARMRMLRCELFVRGRYGRKHMSVAYYSNGTLIVLNPPEEWDKTINI